MMHDSIRSKSYRFFERYAQAEYHNKLFKNIVFILSVLCVIQALGLSLFLIKPRAIYYVPGAVMQGFSYPNHIPDESVGAFATMWLLGWINYTPETTTNVFERSAKYMAPEFLSKAKAILLQEMARVKQDRISSVFAMNKEAQIRKDKNIYVVVLEGERGVYMGKEEILLESVKYEISLSVVPVNESNPFGLMIIDLKKSKRAEDES